MLRAFSLFAVTLLAAAPAVAETAQGAWELDATTLRAPLAHLAFPRSIGGLTLNEAKEFSHPGEKLDNIAEYRSADRTVWATVYLYRPGYPDVAIAAYATDRHLPQVYGASLRRLTQGVAAFGSKPGSAIRITYTGGVRENSGPLASAAAFARIGGWIVKLRVSGPAARQSEVEATLDAMLAAAVLTDGATPFTARPLRFDAPCPAAPSGSVTLIGQRPDINPDALANAMEIASEGLLTGTAADKAEPAFPANGLTPVCVRGTIGTLDVLQPSGVADPDRLMVVLNDIDDVVSVRKNLVGKGFALAKTSIGGGVVLGTVDRLPDTDALALMFKDQPAGVLTASVKVAVAADGKPVITIGTAKK